VRDIFGENFDRIFGCDGRLLSASAVTLLPACYRPAGRVVPGAASCNEAKPAEIDSRRLHRQFITIFRSKFPA